MHKDSEHRKIAIDCRLFGASGIGTFIENIVRTMAADSSLRLTLIGDSRRLRKYDRRSNCTIVDCHHKVFSFNELLRFPINAVNCCDVFFTPNFNIPMGIRVPIFSMVHDIVFFDTKSFGTRMHRMIIKWYIRRALRISHTVFTVSQFSRGRIQKFFNIKADIQVIYNGVSSELKEYAVSVPPTDTKKSGIVFLGNLKKHKGIRTLLCAHSRLANEGMHMPLTIIGNINFRTRDNELIKLLSNRTKSDEASIQLVSNATNRDAYSLISQAEVLVSPSLYEGFGLPPLEALYLGTRVIISDIPVYKEVYDELRHNGLPITFFHAGDADNLYEKIKKLKDVNSSGSSQSVTLSRQLIDERYNFERIAKLIVAYIYQDSAQS